MGLHLKEQLAYDVWFIIFATWLICIVERNQLEVPATSSYGTFSVFDVIFEVCSAYANVGLSIGSPSVSRYKFLQGKETDTFVTEQHIYLEQFSSPQQIDIVPSDAARPHSRPSSAH